MKLKQAVPFVAAAFLSWMPLHAAGALPPGELYFWVGAYGVDPRDQLTYSVHYVDAKGSERHSVHEVSGKQQAMFLLPDFGRDLRIEAVRRGSFSMKKTVEYRCSKRPIPEITMSFSRDRSNWGCG